MLPNGSTLFLTSAAVAAELRAAGKKCGDRTPYQWARTFPISVRIGGSRLFPAEIVPMLLSGIPLAEIPNELRKRTQYAPRVHLGEAGDHPASTG